MIPAGLIAGFKLHKIASVGVSEVQEEQLSRCLLML